MDLLTMATRGLRRSVTCGVAALAITGGVVMAADPLPPGAVPSSPKRLASLAEGKGPKIEWKRGALGRYNYPAILWSFDEESRRQKPGAPLRPPGGPGRVEKVTTAAVDVQFLDAETGKPIAEVEALVSFEKTEPQVVLTDEKGRFSADSVPIGQYTVASHAPGYYDDRKSFYAQAGHTTKVELRLRPRPAAIAGTLTDAAEKPQAKVRLVLKDEKGTVIQTLETLADGSFGLFGLKSGKYRLETEAGKRLEEFELEPGDIKTLDVVFK